MNTLLKWKKGHPVPIEHLNNSFLSLQHEVNKAFRGFYDIFSSHRPIVAQFENLNLLPSMDVVEDEAHISVQIEMQGMDEKTLKYLLRIIFLRLLAKSLFPERMKIKNFFRVKLAMEDMSDPFLYYHLLMQIKSRQLLRKACSG
ncbi:heat shock protein [Legionella sainthelensi]|nr:heat shock protein [Legionella sainthelensi]